MINFSLRIDKPRWWRKVFKCKHEPWRVETDTDSRYGVHSAFLYCHKCGAQGDLARTCDHSVNIFGKCNYCLQRFKHEDCLHTMWCTEPDTDDQYCDTCGEWKDTIDKTKKWV